MTQKRMNTQYTIRGDVWMPCAQTIGKMPAGFYDVVEVGSQVGLRAKDIVSDELIDMPGTIADDIFADAKMFLEAQDDYKAYGLTHKRGYLFFGPPGSGKTSLGQMLARRFIDQVDGVVMFIDSMSALYNGVEIMREVEPDRPSMFLIEEVEMIINNPLGLSILDGERSIQGAIFVAMTNYKEKLPPRIANRPGRFDRVELVECPPPAVQIEYLRRIAERRQSPLADCTPHSAPPAIARDIVEALAGLPLSMAHLREAFISYVLMGLTLSELRKRFEEMGGYTKDISPSFDHYENSEWKPNDDENPFA